MEGSAFLGCGLVRLRFGSFTSLSGSTQRTRSTGHWSPAGEQSGSIKSLSPKCLRRSILASPQKSGETNSRCWTHCAGHARFATMPVSSFFSLKTYISSMPESLPPSISVNFAVSALPHIWAEPSL